MQIALSEFSATLEKNGLVTEQMIYGETRNLYYLNLVIQGKISL